jgi:hypothetical protein
LNPIKSKDLIASVANETNLSTDVVNEIIKTYWKEVRTSLSELKYPYVHISNFGTFKIKYWLIDKEIEKFTNILAKMKSSDISVRKQYIINTAEDKLRLLENLQKEYVSEMQRKNFIKLHKKNVKTNI